MPHCRRLLALVVVPYDRPSPDRLNLPFAALVAIALVALFASPARAQGSSASESPLHLPAHRFEFVASGEAQPAEKPLRVHNGGTIRFSEVRVTRLTYADPQHGAAWLVVHPRQSTVAPDELATVGTLCVDVTGLPAGTYRATAAVAAREVPEPVAITVTLVVTDAAARARHVAGPCATTVK